MKNLKLLLGMLVIGVAAWSCSSDNEKPAGPATIENVAVSLTIEGDEDTYTLTDRGQTIEYVTTVAFPQGGITWTSPTIEQSLNAFLQVTEDDVTVLDGGGNEFGAVDVMVENGSVKVKFETRGGSFNYLSAQTFRVVVEAGINSSVETSQLNAVTLTGFESSSWFYTESVSNRTQPVIMTVYPVLEGQEDIGGVQIVTTINGGESATINERSDRMRYSTALQIGIEGEEWTTPTFEQTFDEVLDISAGAVSVMTADGKRVSSARVSVGSGGTRGPADGSTVTVRFNKVNGSYEYMYGQSFVINVEGSFKSDVTDAQISSFGTDGFVSTGRFYLTDPEEVAVADPVEVEVEPIEPYDMVGDTRDYPYKLNVVYFVPSDIEPNPHYQRRLSTLLLTFQLFICEWMEHWGYGYRSFGLPLMENGMIDIVTVYAPETRESYLSGKHGAIQDAVEDHYMKYNLTEHSVHYLLITASNGNNNNLPFYGSGKWAFAVDYPGMSQETFPTDGSALAGGMMHELGHGGFNMPHVGPSYSQRDDPEFGMTLMGSGNYTYGKTPTFLHETSAATLNTCQLAALTTGTFYTEISSTTAHVPEVIIDGGQCTVKGQASSLYNIEDVVVRFYNSTETFLGGSSGYTSVAFRAKTLYNGSNYNYEVTFPIEELRTVNSTSMRLGVTALPANGNRYSNTPETVYQLVNNGGEYTLTVK